MRNKIILASASPRRKELLQRISACFEVVVSGVDESKAEGVKEIALLKARAVASKHPDAVVIGADTIVELDGRILGKPKDKAQAVLMLMSLSGRENFVTTGLAVIFPGGRTITDTVTTVVKMKKYSLKEAQRYVDDFLPLDKAGAYGIQEMDEVFIDSIRGDYDNVVGLPVKRLSEILSMSA
ncbi:MAG: Maf family protein [Candidatus Margulisiibacteriota bacterium]